VTFTPKPGKPSYTEAKAYRPICFSSFLLKTLERLVHRHIRNDVLGKNPLHINQYAYQSGKSTDTAQTSMVITIEKVLQTQEFALGAFLDIEGAFDSTSIEAISTALLRHGVPPVFERWIASMLRSRCIISSLMGETMQVASVRDCPQGGVLSPLLWNLTMDELLRDLNEAGYHSVGFADDIAIIIRGKFPSTVTEVLQNALKRLENWCNS
jgi:Reverse transcriptase (RNA-dependent DNA polymerase).